MAGLKYGPPAAGPTWLHRRACSMPTEPHASPRARRFSGWRPPAPGLRDSGSPRLGALRRNMVVPRRRARGQADPVVLFPLRLAHLRRLPRARLAGDLHPDNLEAALPAAKLMFRHPLACGPPVWGPAHCLLPAHLAGYRDQWLLAAPFGYPSAAGHRPAARPREPGAGELRPATNRSGKQSPAQKVRSRTVPRF